MKAYADQKNNAEVREKARLTEQSLQEMYNNLSGKAKEVVRDYGAEVFEDENVISGEGNLEFLGATVRVKKDYLLGTFKSIPEPFKKVLVEYLKNVSEKYGIRVEELAGPRLIVYTPSVPNREQLEPLQNFIEHYAALISSPKFREVVKAFEEETKELAQRYVSKLEGILSQE